MRACARDDLPRRPGRCAVSSRLGPHWLSLSPPHGGDPVPLAEPVLITADTHALYGTHDSRRGVRVGGGVLVAASIAAAVVLDVVPLEKDSNCPPDLACVTEVEYDRVPGAIAAAAGVLGVIGGVLMLLTDDAVAVEAR